MADKELEEQLIEVGKQLQHPSAVSEKLLSLLDHVESILIRVEQSPSPSMAAALKLSQDALTMKELLGHTDVDVKVAIASCISEITRITAPDAPYDDDLMKEVFCLIVDSFEDLSDTSSSSYSRRLSILETVAKVRSCVVMLDLECDDLILKMFQCFLKTIRESHPPKVFISMETIMTLVLEESEDISSELLSCLLSSVKKEKQSVSPVAYKLGEKVIANCASKLKPYLLEEMKLRRITFSSYGKVVASLCQETSDMKEPGDMDVSSHALVDELKISEKADTSEAHKDHQIADSGDKAGIDSTGKEPVPVMSNGTVSSEKEHPDSPSQLPLPSCHPNNAKVALPSVTQTEPGEASKSNRRRKPNSLVSVLETSDHSRTENQKEPAGYRDQKEGTCKEDNIPESLVSSADKLPMDEVKVDSPEKLLRETVLSTSAQSLRSERQDSAGRPKRGRPPGRKKIPDIKADVDKYNVVPQNKEILSGEEKEDYAGEAVDRNKLQEPEDVNGLEFTIDEDDTRGPDAIFSEGDGGQVLPPVSGQTKKEVSGRRPKRRKGSFNTEKQLFSRRSSKKKMASSDKSAAVTEDQHPVEEASQIKSKKKQVPSLNEKSKAVQYDETINGSRVMVWWPDDEEFYKGRVDSYDPIAKKHKILYDDGDEEILHLEDEIWKFVDDHELDEAEVTVVRKNDVPLERNKKAKRSPGLLSQQEKSGSMPGRTPGSSAGKSKGGNGKHGAKMKGGDSAKSGSKFKSATPKMTPALKDMSGSKSKDGPPRSGAKSGSKSRDELLLNAGKGKGEMPKIGAKSTTNGTSAKGKSITKGLKGDDFDKGKPDVDASESDAKSGKKRQRKSYGSS